MSPKQKKLAAKAPPPNKIDAKDFAVLRAEKAKGRGMGLQDEKVQPGKVMKAKRGTGVLTEKGTSKTFRGFSKAFEGPTDLRGRVSTIVGVKPNAPIRGQRKKFKSMDEMRKAKGFKPGETASQFNKRRAAIASAKQIAKSSKIGKIALGVAAAGLGAKKYLESKMNKKKDVKKKMSGGMASQQMRGRQTTRQKKQVDPSQRSSKSKLQIYLFDKDKSKIKPQVSVTGTSKKMGGGMMQRPMGYDIGGGVSRAKEHKKKIKDKAGTVLGYAGEMGKTVAKATPVGATLEAGKKLAEVVKERREKKTRRSKMIERLKEAPRRFPRPKIEKRPLPRRLPLPLNPGPKTRPKRMPGTNQPPKYTPLNKGGGADSGKKNIVGTLKPNPGDKAIHHFGRRESKPYTGGNRSRPKILARGGSVKVKCKLGRNKPTKMY